MSVRLALKVDVDTDRGTREGVPRFRHLILALTASLLLAGCISSPAENMCTRDYNAGEEAEAAGNLETAQRDYQFYLTNTQLGNLGPAKEAYACYELARVTGYLGRYAEAEKGFNDTLALIDQANGQADRLRPPLLCEYARMLRDSGQEQKAAPVYARALLELERVGSENADPLGFADFLDDYAEVLRDVGSKERADEVASRSAAIKDNHKGETAKFSNRQSYANAGRAAQGRDDWAGARMYWSRAVAAAESAHVPPAQLAVYDYEYGRSLGAVGAFADAEIYLKKALKLDQENGGDCFMDLTELARLNYDQHKFAGAAAYYEQDIVVLDLKNTETSSPAAFVDLLTEYADCLRQTGREAEARKAEDRIARIKANNPVLHSNTDRTPYGKYPPKQN
jgi:tetratricopeptide (TPR) repeat protein